MKTIFCWGAKPHRHEVGNLFRTGAENSVLGLAEPDEIIIKLEDSKEINTIIERLKNTERYAYALSCIDSIREFKPFINKGNKEGPEDYKVKLIDFQNYEQNTAIRKYFEKAIMELGLEVKKTDYSPDQIVYNIQSISLDSFQAISDNNAFEAIFSIEPMPKFILALDMMEDEATIDISLPKEGEEIYYSGNFR